MSPSLEPDVGTDYVHLGLGGAVMPAALLHRLADADGLWFALLVLEHLRDLRLAPDEHVGEVFVWTAEQHGHDGHYLRVVDEAGREQTVETWHAGPLPNIALAVTWWGNWAQIEEVTA